MGITWRRAAVRGVVGGMRCVALGWGHSGQGASHAPCAGHTALRVGKRGLATGAEAPSAVARHVEGHVGDVGRSEEGEKTSE